MKRNNQKICSERIVSNSSCAFVNSMDIKKCSVKFIRQKCAITNNKMFRYTSDHNRRYRFIFQYIGVIDRSFSTEQRSVKTLISQNFHL